MPDADISAPPIAGAGRWSFPTVSRWLAWRVLAVVCVLGALWGAATLLARAAHQQRVARGADAWTRGTRALAARRPADAAAAFREAVAFEPHRADYRLDLAKALLAMHRETEAEAYVQETLRQEPVHGEANLVLARILHRLGNREEAEGAYYRAIYGRWAPGQQPLRLQARLELVSLFKETGDRTRLRSALLELSSAFPGDRALQLQAGRELLASGFGDDAARQLRAVVERFTDAGDAVALLARAEFARGNYIEAFAAAGRAVAHDRTDRDSAALRALSARILSLDPAQPRLRSGERASRVRYLLLEARRRLAACRAGASGPAASPVMLPPVDRWLARRDADVDVGRALLEATATRLRATCPAPAADDAAGLLLADLAGGRQP